MPETAGKPWSDREVEAIVQLYLRLAKATMQHQHLVKREAYRQFISEKAPARTISAVEYKLRNVSAVMTDLGLPPLQGLAPARNIQGTLTEAVRAQLLADHHEPLLEQLVTVAAERAASYATGDDESIVDAPSGEIDSPAPLRDVRHFDWDDAERRRLGLLGERWVIKHERAKLEAAGLQGLADDVLHVSVEHGDGAGYDVRSFSTNGTERLVEVKTTAMTIGRAFYVSRNEVEVSRKRHDRYWLYRVFNYYERPQMYQVRGALDIGFALTPSVYRARRRVDG